MVKNSSIHLNIIKNRITDVKKQIKKDIKLVNILGEYDSTPLHYACREKNLEIVKILIKNGANINQKNRYSTLYPIFDTLIYINKRDPFPIIELLIKSGADINSVDSFGNTLLHHAVEQENMKLIELLITYGCNINYTLRHDKDTPLHYACFRKNRKIIYTLIENNANREALNIYNRTPESYL